MKENTDWAKPLLDRGNEVLELYGAYPRFRMGIQHNSVDKFHYTLERNKGGKYQVVYHDVEFEKIINTAVAMNRNIFIYP